VRILVADSDAAARSRLSYRLHAGGHTVDEVADGMTALARLDERPCDMLVADVQLQRIDGLALLRRVRERHPEVRVALVASHPRVTDAIAAFHGGAFDFVVRGRDADDAVADVVERASAARSDWSPLGAESALVGRSPVMQRLERELSTVARSDAPVLIVGESGTGKEMIANALHSRSARGAGPFVAINCAALPEPLLEAELFGHARGAFTGAIRQRDGRFKQAHGGTLLLDEVAELPLAAQAKLLRVLAEGVVHPLGTNLALEVDVRIVSATHQNLKDRVVSGRFREDLYYRLNVLDLRVPPLRERTGDLPLLYEHFLRACTPHGQPTPPITPRAWRALCRHPFPGNVRELAHAVERAAVLCRGDAIDLAHLPADIAGEDREAVSTDGDFRPLSAALRDFERDYVQQALRLANGKRTRAAELLGISRKCLWEKLRPR
jgi:DNA-binding NtrC family response regulator